MKLSCPYCGEGIITGETPCQYCCTCGAAHHRDCWEENGGCTVYGCASAPADEPKINVAPTDFQPTRAPVATVPPPPVRVAPPPRPGPPAQNQIAQPASPRPQQFSFGGYNVHPPAGFPSAAAPYPYAPYPAYHPGYLPPQPKSRVGFIMLGVFLGIFGVHNFYAGYKGKAIAQLCMTLCSFFMLAFASAIWAIVEVCTVERDSMGVPMS